jgi:OOP family OmpA-OmpF porin
MIGNFLGSARSGVIDNISKYAGIKESSTSSLMSMALPPMMGILGKHAEQNNLSASGLAGFLSSQKDHIMQALPAGLTSMAGVLGLGSIGSATSSVTSNIKSPIDEVHTISETPKAKWLVPLIVILTILALLWYFSKSCNQTKPSTATDTDSTAMIQNTTNATFLFPITKAEIYSI